MLLDYQKTNEPNDILNKYSYDPAELRRIVESCRISASFIRMDNNFFGDTHAGMYEDRAVFRITITRNGMRISFEFGSSIADTEKYGDTVPPDMLYSVLSCIGSDYHCPDTFAEFCGEF